MTTILVLIITFIAMFVQTIAGFGYGSVSVPICSLFISTNEATALTSTVALVSIIILATITIKKVNYKLLLYTIPTALIVLLIGNIVSTKLSDTILKKFLGIVLVLSAIYQLLLIKKIKPKQSMPLAITMGFVSGFMQGTFVMGGQPIALYLLTAIDDKDEYLGTMSMYFVILNAVNVTTKIFNKSINFGNARLVILMMVPTCLAIYFGRKAVKKLTLSSIKTIIYVFMIVIGTYITIFG